MNKTLKTACFISVLMETDKFHSKRTSSVYSLKIVSNIHITNTPIFLFHFKQLARNKPTK